jgi:long-chain acyl-CoA synthetase
MPLHIEYPHVPAWWIMERNLDRFADKTGVIFINHEDLSEIQRLTYAELWRGANSLAAGLRELGVRKGERVAVVLPNSPALIMSYYGIWMSGGAITPCNLMAKEKEIECQLQDSGACLLIADGSLAETAMPVAERLGMRTILASTGECGKKIPGEAISFEELIATGQEHPMDFSIDPGEDMAVLLYTGGTTGTPKGAILTHRNIVANTIQFAEWYAFEPGREISICAIPMSHSGGMSGVMNVPIYAGATLVVMKRFRPEAVALAIEKYCATRFLGVPTMFVALLHNEEARRCNLSTLKACRTNAAPLLVAVKKAFDEFIGKETLIEGYGLTETSPLTHANPIQRAKPGSIGIPLPDTDCRIVSIEGEGELPVGSEGELLIRGPQVMKGYWNKPEATAKAMAEGWLHTGDIARMDEEGYFYIVDRLKDMINCGGYKVWPREVEEVLYTHPKVRLAMVVGSPDDYYGEIAKAFVVPRDEARGDISSEEVISFCRKAMAAYKVPRLVEFVDRLPITPQGKMLRRLMREGGEKERENHG